MMGAEAPPTTTNRPGCRAGEEEEEVGGILHHQQVNSVVRGMRAASLHNNDMVALVY